MHGQDRVVAGHTADAVAHYYREETAVIGRGRRRGSIGRLGRSGDVHAVLTPLIAQRGRSCSRHAKFGRLPHGDCLVGRLGRDRWRCFHRQCRVIAGHASSNITDYNREETAVIGRGRCRSGIGSTCRSRDVRPVLPPLVAQRGRPCRGHAKRGCLSHIDCLIGRLSRDRGRYRRWRRCRCWSRSWG